MHEAKSNAIQNALEEPCFGHSENQILPLRAGDPPLSRPQKAVPVFREGLSR